MIVDDFVEDLLLASEVGAVEKGLEVLPDGALAVLAGVLEEGEEVGQLQDVVFVLVEFFEGVDYAGVVGVAAVVFG
jgi:hypothetical protein